jgi:hypothetical protein
MASSETDKGTATVSHQAVFGVELLIQMEQARKQAAAVGRIAVLQRAARTGGGPKRYPPLKAHRVMVAQVRQEEAA